MISNSHFRCPTRSGALRQSTHQTPSLLRNHFLFLCGKGEEAAGALAALPGVEVGALGSGTADGILSLLDDLLGLGQDEFDVAWVGHVWVDLIVMLASSRLQD